MTTSKVGLDVGFGDTKAALLRADNGGLDIVSFPSILGNAQQLTTISAGLSTAARRKATRLVYEDVEYYIGLDALKHSRTQAGRQDRGRIGSTEERVLALAALARLGVSEAYIVTGLPVLWLDDLKKLRRSLRGQHRFTWGKEERTINIIDVKVRPQPFGGFYSYVLHSSGAACIPEDYIMQKWGMLDIGWNTTDISALDELEIKDRWSGGERVGVRDVIDVVGDVISREHGLNLPPHEVDKIIQDKSVRISGQIYHLDQVITSAVKNLSEQIVSTATRVWNEGKLLDHIIIFGGGGAVFGPALKSAFHHAVVLDHPANANAVGFCYYAQRDIWK